MSESFRSTHAGKPGSLMAIRVDYPLTSNAFESVPPNDPRRQRHNEIKKYTSGLRIGEKADWNASTVDELHPFPSHSPQRTLSEFQGVKMAYNFRASALPMVNKASIFVRRPNKMQMDASLFLSRQEKARIVPVCPGTSAALSRHELQNHTGTELEQRWNCSMQLPDERVSAFKLPTYERMTERNKQKRILHPDAYVPLVERYEQVLDSQREMKLSRRARDASIGRVANHDSSVAQQPVEWSEGGTVVLAGAPKVFKMSNKSQWWELNPLGSSMATGGMNSTTGSVELGAREDSRHM